MGEKSLEDAIGEALAALDVLIEDEDDIDMIDLSLAESAICEFEGIDEVQGRKTQDLAQALALLAEALEKDLDQLINAAELLHEVQRSCGYDGGPSPQMLRRASKAQQQLYAGLEELVRAQGEDEDENI